MFFGFGGADGMPHGMGGGGRRGPVDNEKLYKTLGIDKTATPQQIKKAFRKLAMVHHPDKGGDPDRFKEITHAYEVLSDPEKRQRYDEGGEEAIEDGGGVDLGDMLFGGGRRRGGRPGKRKGESTKFPLKVTLDDLYKGTTKRLRITKSVLCNACGGKGGSGAPQPCSSCRGHGVKIRVRQLGPGMLQQMQVQCDDCNGEGSRIAASDLCRICSGKKTVKEKKILQVFINRGAKHRSKITFNGEADQQPGVTPGDVIVELYERPHKVFKREGPHLTTKRTISLVEALTGFQFVITHLDGRKLLVSSEPGMVYKPGDVKAIRGEGMPVPRGAFQSGNLYVQLDVEFPTQAQLSGPTRTALRSMLPCPPAVDRSSLGGNFEDHQLETVDIEAERNAYDAPENEAYAEDEEQEHVHAGPGGCRQA